MATALCPACMNEVNIPPGTRPGLEIQCPYCYSSFVPVTGSQVDLDLEGVKEAVAACCLGESECGGCQQEACLIGFAKRAVEIAEERGTVRIPDGEKLLPREDFRYYDPVNLEDCLVEVLLSCKSCKEFHTNDCVRNLLRNAIEIALLGKTIDYKGSVFLYLVDLDKVSPRVGERVAAAYRSRKGLG